MKLGNLILIGYLVCVAACATALGAVAFYMKRINEEMNEKMHAMMAQMMGFGGEAVIIPTEPTHVTKESK